MAFTQPIIDYINDYALKDLPDDTWFDDYFSFIKDSELAARLKIEFKNARYIYKLFEGLQANNELRLAQVRTQMLMYTSIYEACIHYILFEYYKESEEVNKLILKPSKVRISIPEVKLIKLEKELKHDRKDIIPYYVVKKKRDITKVRFDEKCYTALAIGILESDLCNELIEFYNIRNCIHIHAELRKELVYELEQSKLAYWRFQKFRNTVTAKLKKDGII